MTQRDTLFLLKADFHDGNDQPYYCPDCAEIEGVLACFPRLRAVLDVRYSAFARPRHEIVALVGEEHQNCPLLVLAGKPAAEHIAGLDLGHHEPHYFLTGPHAIGTYFARVHGVSLPH